MRRIFEESFPPHERSPWEQLAGRLGDGATMYTAQVDGEVAAFAHVVALPRGTALVLEYLATSSEHRNRGYGGRLLDEVVRLERERGQSGRLMIEAEWPDEVEGEERELRRRRVAFYERHGAAAVECAPGYRAPDLEKPGAVRYSLLWVPLRDDAAAPRGDVLRDLITEIFVVSYERPPDDELLASVLSELAC